VTLDPEETAPSGVVVDPAVAAEAVPRSARLSFRRALMTVSDELWPDLRWESIGELPTLRAASRAPDCSDAVTLTEAAGSLRAPRRIDADVPRAA
jgi:hypothetical protein